MKRPVPHTVATCAVAVAVGTVLAVTLAPPVRSEAAAPPPVTHRTVYATRGDTSWSMLQKLTLDRAGKVDRVTDVAPDGIRYDQAADVSSAGLVFTSEPGYITVRRASGGYPVNRPGTHAVFTPSRTAVLITRRVDVAGTPGPESRDRLVLYTLANRRERVVTTLPAGHVVTDLRYSLDRKSIWLHTVRSGGGEVGLQEYRIAAGRIVRTVPVPGCPDFEMLPSGQRAVLACEVTTRTGTTGQLWTVQLSTGKVLHRIPLPTGHVVDKIQGRLSDRVLLVSAHSARAGANEPLYWLGGLDTATMSIRSLRGSTHFHSAASAY